MPIANRLKIIEWFVYVASLQYGFCEIVSILHIILMLWIA